jgi:drug/metabolite transporter (DMT)-like permease
MDVSIPGASGARNLKYPTMYHERSITSPRPWNSALGRIAAFGSIALALIAFATNSILCRVALISSQIGPLEFTVVRVTAGMLMLSPILLFGNRGLRSSETVVIESKRSAGSVLTRMPAAVFLFTYAMCFSLAYVTVSTGTGALILFASVQLTMMAGSIRQGQVLSLQRWLGTAVAMLGLVILFLPGLSAPPLGGAILMVSAGIAWGIYSLMGKRVQDPVAATARNFLYCLPGCVALLLFLWWGKSHGAALAAQPEGLLLAGISGSLASGLGYVMWYRSLKLLTVATASIIQLSVPVLAACGGVLFLGEKPTSRLAVATLLILGGILVSTLSGVVFSPTKTELSD